MTNATNPSVVRTPRQKALAGIGLDLAARAFGGQIAPEDLAALAEVIGRLLDENHECLPRRERAEPERYGYGRAA